MTIKEMRKLAQQLLHDEPRMIKLFMGRLHDDLWYRCQYSCIDHEQLALNAIHKGHQSAAKFRLAPTKHSRAKNWEYPEYIYRWLRTIAQNLLRDRLRQLSGEYNALTSNSMVDIQSLPESAVSDETSVEIVSKELTQFETELSIWMSKLSESHSMILTSIYSEYHITDRELARRAKITENYVRVIRKRLKDKVEALYAKHHPDSVGGTNRTASVDDFNPQIPNSARILLVEDNHLHAEMFRSALDEPTVDVSSTKACGLKRAKSRKNRYDLIVLDLALPDGNGFELADAIRASGYARGIVLLTDYWNPSYEDCAPNYGIDGHFEKPGLDEQYDRAELEGFLLPHLAHLTEV